MRKILMNLLANFPFAKSKADFIKEEIGVENYRILQEIKNYKLEKVFKPSCLLKHTLKISTIKHPLKHLLERILKYNSSVFS
jgi:hypothetical protein